MPGALDWWPPAPGWWLLSIGSAAALLALFVLRRRHRYRAAVLKELDRIRRDLDAGAQPLSCVQRISTVLRRYAMTISADPAAVAGLTGSRWLEYLDARSDRPRFATAAGGALVSAPYAPPGHVDAEQARALVQFGVEWVNSSRPER
jgi:hypothetical protein